MLRLSARSGGRLGERRDGLIAVCFGFSSCNGVVLFLRTGTSLSMRGSWAERACYFLSFLLFGTAVFLVFLRLHIPPTTAFFGLSFVLNWRGEGRRDGGRTM